MEEVAAKRDKEIRPGFVLSILLHVLFVAIFLLPLLPAPPEAKPEQSVNVELVPQQEEKQELATKANEKPDQPPKPTPKPDEKPQEAKKPDEQAQADAKVQTQDNAKADSVKQPADKPDDKDSGAKSEQRASAPEKPSETKAEQSEQKPIDKSDSEAAQADATSASPDDIKPTQNVSSPKQADTPTTDNATLSPTVTDSQPEEQSTTSADTNSAQSATEQADANAQATATPAASDSDSQSQKQASSAQGGSDDKSTQPNATTPASDPNSSDTASMSKPEELATDLPSATKVDQPDTPPTDQTIVGSQARTSAAADSLAPQIAVPRIVPSQQQPQATSEGTGSNNGNGQGDGTALVVEPEAGHGQQSSIRPVPQATQEGSKLGNTGPAKAEPGVAAGPFIQAKQFYSSKELAGLPRSFLVKWKGLPEPMRMSQLCNAETAAQLNAVGIHVIGFGIPKGGESRNSTRSIEADNAVYRTPDGYNYVGIKCGLDVSATKVTSFAYRLGAAIPQDKWKSLSLPSN